MLLYKGCCEENMPLAMVDENNVSSICQWTCSTDEESRSKVTCCQSAGICSWDICNNEMIVKFSPLKNSYHILKVSVGINHVLFLTGEGKVFSQGCNSHGQLGLGPEYLGQSQSNPQLIPAFLDVTVTNISVGYAHSAATTVDGDVYCWGDSAHGQCGCGSVDVLLTPNRIIIGTTSDGFLKHHDSRQKSAVLFDSVSCGEMHTLALSRDGELWSWGTGDQLGLDYLLHTLVPQRVSALVGRQVLSVVCGNHHCLALVKKGNQSAAASHAFSQASALSVCSMGNALHRCSVCEFCQADISGPADFGVEQVDTSDQRFLHDSFPCSDNSLMLSDSQCTDDVDKHVTPACMGTSDCDAFVDYSCRVLDAMNITQKSTASQSSVDFASMQKEDKCVAANSFVEDGNFAHSYVPTKNISSYLPKMTGGSDCTKRNVDTSVCGVSLMSECVSVSHLSVSCAACVESNEEIWKHRSETVDSSFCDWHDVKFEERIVINSLPIDSSQVDCIQHSESNDCKLEDKIPSLTTPCNGEMKRNRVVSTLSDVILSGSHLQAIASSPPSTNVPNSSCHIASAAMTDHAVSVDRCVAYTKTDFPNFDTCDLGLNEERLHTLHSQSEQFSQLPVSLHGGTYSIADTSCEEGLPAGFTDYHLKRIDCSVSGSTSIDDASDSEQDISQDIVETEIWAWGDNSMGQLGLADDLRRSRPVCITVFSTKCIWRIAAGANHSLALSSNYSVYSWGCNGCQQLGHSGSESVPVRVKFGMETRIWDIAAGANHSLFLADDFGTLPKVFCCGKRPGSVFNTAAPTVVTELNEAGWIRGIAAGADNSYCLLGLQPSILLGAVYDLASYQRAFYHELVKINNNLLRPLSKSSLLTSTDTSLLKSALYALVSGFTDLAKNCICLVQIGHCVANLTGIAMADKPLSAHLLLSYITGMQVLAQYSDCFSNFLAVSGFRFCLRNESKLFGKCYTQESTADPPAHNLGKHPQCEQPYFQRCMQAPFRHLSKYTVLLHQLSEAFNQCGIESNLIRKVAHKWNRLKYKISADHKLADATRVFWENVDSVSISALMTPSRRMIRNSMSHPLAMSTSGWFSTHHFVLFNDIFLHVQSGNQTIFPLETLWIETPDIRTNQLPTIIMLSPESRTEFHVQTQEEKTGWVTALNSAISKVLSARYSKMAPIHDRRMSPSLVRHTSHTFVRRPDLLGGAYTGTWLNAEPHGHGEIIWEDGTSYTGSFDHGLKHGNGVLVMPKGESGTDILDGNWKLGELSGFTRIKYANGDSYTGHCQAGHRHGHGTLQQGHHLSSFACVYIGQWMNDKRHGYGVEDNILRGEKYMGLWMNDYRHGNAVLVTLDGMYFEGNFHKGKLLGFGLMFTDDDTCYEGHFSDVTQLSGKGTLTLTSGDQLVGTFSGCWIEGLKISGKFIKGNNANHRCLSASKRYTPSQYGKLSVPADKKWCDLFVDCHLSLGHDICTMHVSNMDSVKAWHSVCRSSSRGKWEVNRPCALEGVEGYFLEQLERSVALKQQSVLTVKSYKAISLYLQKAFDDVFHPVGELVSNVVEVFKLTYVGVGVHPRLLCHALRELQSYVIRLYHASRVLFPQLPVDGGPIRIFPEMYHSVSASSTENSGTDAEEQQAVESSGEVLTAAGLIHPILLPKVYPPLFDLYALFCDHEDERYWEQVTKLNRQADWSLMAFLSVDQRFWFMEDVLQADVMQRDACFSSAVDALQYLSTAFSPMDKLLVIQSAFNMINQTVQYFLGDKHLLCMDELFPIFHFVVVRSKIKHLGAEIQMMEDLMERHFEHGELGIMLTILKVFS